MHYLFFYFDIDFAVIWRSM